MRNQKNTKPSYDYIGNIQRETPRDTQNVLFIFIFLIYILFFLYYISPLKPSSYARQSEHQRILKIGDLMYDLIYIINMKI